MDQSAKSTISMKEQATTLGISPNKTFDLVRLPDFPNIHLGGRWLFPIHAMERWLAQPNEQERNCPC